MATPNRRYPEAPGAVSPDVPYVLNTALRAIDQDVQAVADTAEKARTGTSLAATAASAAQFTALETQRANTIQDGRLAQLETKAGFTAPGLKLTDDAMAGVLTDTESRFSKFLGGLFATTRTENTVRRQAHLLGQFRRELRSGAQVTVAAKGDSLTYGYDVNSADRVPADTTPAGDGTRHVRERSPRPWPRVLQDRLQEAYGAGKVTVLNQGYSGDTVLSALGRWPAASGAGLTIFSLGTNDAGQLSLEDFVGGYERLILREINEFSSAVIIFTSLKQRAATGNYNIDAYRGALLELGSKYGVPVIDTVSWLSGYPTDHFSDGTHLTTKGYNVIGTRAAALFLGNGPAAPNRVSDGSRLSVRPGLDGITYGPGVLLTSGSASGTMTEGLAGEPGGPGIRATMGSNAAPESVYYSIFTETADTVLHLTYGLYEGATISAALDWGIPQGSSVQSTLVDVPASDGSPSASSWSHTQAVGIRNYTNMSEESRFLLIAHPGWHTVKITGQAKTVNLYALEFFNFRSMIAARKSAAYIKPVPAQYDISKDITSTRISWPELMDTLGLKDWATTYYHAPALKVTVRSYDHMVQEYLLTVNAGRNTTGANRPAIEALVPLRATPLRASPNMAYVRELAAVEFDEATRELIFKLKTDGGKDLRYNFNLTVSIL